jgi:hypothetical protein
MKTTRTIATVSLLLTIILCTVSCISLAETDAGPTLSFDRYYIIMPELNVRADPDTTGAIGKVYAGQEVEFLYSAGNYSMFNYQQDGKTLSGSTWTGAIAPAVRIHILEDAFIYHRPGMSRTDLGSISTWREPSDPDLLILWEENYEGETWYYVLSIEDGRSGYMKGDIAFEVVE